jgi:hypothetical protein
MNSKEDIERMRHILSMKASDHHKLDAYLTKIITSGWLDTEEAKEASKKWGYYQPDEKLNS